MLETRGTIQAHKGSAWLLLGLSALVQSCAVDSGRQDTKGGGDEPAERVAASRQALSTPPDTLCVGSTFNGHDYWACPTLRSWQGARDKCKGIGFDLASSESSAENQFLLSKLPGNTWIGGTDSVSEGAWKWVTGTQFWQGKSSGSAVGGAFTAWKAGQPDDLSNQDCAIFWGGLGAGKWSDESCSLLAAFMCEGDLCPSDPNKTEPGKCGCGVADTDTDNDGTPDCTDGCPSDPQKKSPGLCGCGVSDGDSDGDGAVDCQDQCPNDAANIRKPDCGCTNAPKPAGTACSDGICAANVACDGKGVCGQPSACGVPDAHCVYYGFGDSKYWACSDQRKASDARLKCQASGMDLVAIGSAAENDFIKGKTPSFSHLYIGAGDATTEGQYAWLQSGQLFWANGGPVNGAYTNWESGQPKADSPLSTLDCVVKDPPIGGGTWETWNCNTPEPYVCEFFDQCPLDPNKVLPGQCGCGKPDTDSDGDKTADCIDGCPLDPTKPNRGQCGCGKPDTDTDGDKTADCIDACPSDSTKSVFGVCGCGVPDVDTDGDGTLDCNDACRLDPNRIVPGQCGCAGEPLARPAGYLCTDPPCSNLPAATCDGAGTCGGAMLNQCIPTSQPPAGCTVQLHAGHAYLFCTGDQTFTGARTYCAAAGMELVRIDDASENAFVESHIAATSWIGATDSAMEGQWLWVDGNTSFWQGSASGAAVNGQYTHWAQTQPDASASNLDCATYVKGSSASTTGWFSQNCGSAFDFICEVVDQCPTDANKDKPGFCGCGVPDDVITVDGKSVVTCTDQCPDDATKTAPGRCGCGMPESLCPLECPNNLSNPASPVYGKLQAGLCGCNAPDVDADHNGVVDCFERVGQCGTATAPTPAGTACDDGICPQSCPVTTTCNGSGVCGNPATCAPTGGGACQAKIFRDHVYWFCAGPKTRADAEASCAQDGIGHLVSIDDAAENQFVQANITGNSWTSGNDTTTPNDWQWANATCDDAKPFWDGGPSGTPDRNDAYANWAPGAPSGGDFALITAGTGSNAGKWQASSGSASLSFVCEKPRPLPPFCGQDPQCLSQLFGVGPCTPAGEACVPIEQALPELAGKSEQEALDAVTACHDACAPPATQAACEQACAAQGITPPPADSTCAEVVDNAEVREQCLLAKDTNGNALWYPDPATSKPIACSKNADCQGRGDLPADVVCGFLRVCTLDPEATDVPPCPTPAPDEPDVPLEQGGKTGTVRVCGKPSADCLHDEQADPQRCDTTPLLCESAEGQQEVETITFPDGPPQPTCPSQLFEPPLPEPDLTVAYPSWDEPCGSGGCIGQGKNHPYCTYRPSVDGEATNAIDPKRSHALAKNQNKSGSKNIVDFVFDPRLDLDYRAKLGPLGVPDVSVTAGTGLVAKAVINKGKLPFGGDVELVNLTAAAKANRCQVTTAGSHIRLFGHDFLPSGAKLDREIPGCEAALAKFESLANRASKSMRDVASLLKQYENAKQGGGRLDLSPLCALGGVLDDPPEDFPLPMNCTDQPAESHLNELINYYEQQVVALQAQGAALGEDALGESVADVPVFKTTVGDEELTLFAVNFLIGPIPVTLEAYVAAHYSIGLSVGYRLQPGKAVSALILPDAKTGQDHELLAVFVNGGPSAQAFLGFFAGVGFSVGPVAAKLGIEARLSLGKIKLTANGGAGLIMTGEVDPRPLGPDIASLVLPSSKPLISPLVYKLKLGYSAGLEADISDILSGDVNAALKLKFFFFSKTFRQRLLRFKGLCTDAASRSQFPCHIPILELGDATTLGDLPWATVRMSQLLPKLKYLPFTPETATPPTAVPVDMKHIEKLFYDRECSCIAPGQPCKSTGDCCDGITCADDGTGKKICACRGLLESCTENADCCAGTNCFEAQCQ
jgi:hypothetical protein